MESKISPTSEDMKDCIIAADLTNEPLDISIATMAKTINIPYSISGKDIVLGGKGRVGP